jgi:hypothetical protein
MRINLSLNGHKIGYIDYNLLNVPDKMGYLGTVFAQPTALMAILTRKIKQNEDIAIRGGATPPDLSMYFDGLCKVLDKMKEEIEGFDFLIPPEHDPWDENGLGDSEKQEGIVY